MRRADPPSFRRLPSSRFPVAATIATSSSPSAAAMAETALDHGRRCITVVKAGDAASEKVSWYPGSTDASIEEVIKAALLIPPDATVRFHV